MATPSETLLLLNFFLVILHRSAKSLLNGKMLNSVAICSDWLPNQTLSSDFVIRRALYKFIKFRSLWPRTPVHSKFRFSLTKAIHSTRVENHRETPTSISVAVGNLLVTVLCRQSKICTHGQLKFTSQWRNRRANDVNVIYKMEWSAAISITLIIDRAFKVGETSQQNWCGVSSNSKCFEI